MILITFFTLGKKCMPSFLNRSAKPSFGLMNTFSVEMSIFTVGKHHVTPQPSVSRGSRLLTSIGHNIKFRLKKSPCPIVKHLTVVKDSGIRLMQYKLLSQITEI